MRRCQNVSSGHVLKTQAAEARARRRPEGQTHTQQKKHVTITYYLLVGLSCPCLASVLIVCLIVSSVLNETLSVHLLMFSKLSFFCRIVCQRVPSKRLLSQFLQPWLCRLSCNFADVIHFSLSTGLITTPQPLRPTSCSLPSQKPRTAFQSSVFCTPSIVCSSAHWSPDLPGDPPPRCTP